MIQGLYETHIQVRDLAKSVAFYTEVLGLRVAHRDPTRPIVFYGLDRGRITCWAYGRKKQIFSRDILPLEQIRKIS
jgi:Glyoxalase/Bleomycin resistance protein/Dioxygenase superfamily.